MNRSAIDARKFVAAVILSMLLTTSLLYVPLDALCIIDELPLKAFPPFFWGHNWDLLKAVSYAMLYIIIWFIVLGFFVKRGYLSVLGSVALNLLTFGYFAINMWFLFAGIGIFRVLWLFSDVPLATTLKLGHIVYVPHLILSAPFLSMLAQGYRPVELSLIIMSIGLFTFFTGVTTWLYGKFKGYKMMDFWVYRYSRHPQYLGFLLWSYGLLLLASFASYPRYGYNPPPWAPPFGYVPPPPTLPWLISSLVIIGVALQEETKMVKLYGEKYVEYRRKTPFMIYLPKILATLIRTPMRPLSKEYPESTKEVIYVIVVYLIMLVLLSIPLTNLT